MPANLTVEGMTLEQYDTAIALLELAREQFAAVAAGIPQGLCTLCGDADHTAESCWYFNPLLLATMGEFAMTGEFWRCFQCGAVYLTAESAFDHFGANPDKPPACVRALNKLSP